MFQRRRSPADFRAEIEAHIDLEAARLREQGFSEADARAAACRAFGNRTAAEERFQERGRWLWLDAVGQDVRLAWRLLAKTPGWTAVALLTLALGIGATASIFSVVNAVLVRPLPYPAADRLVVIGEGPPSPTSIANIGFATFSDLRDEAASLEGLAAIRSWQPTLVTAEAERLNGVRVSWNYFSLLGVRPALGRTFAQADDHPDRWRVLILSDALWRRRFNADPGVIGRALRMNDQAYEVIGVMPAGFEDLAASRFYSTPDVWAALGYDASLPSACRTCRHLKTIGMMKSQTTVAGTRSDLASVHARLAKQFPADYGDDPISVVPLKAAVAGPVREPLLVLSAAAAFVLLIACANVANLLLARGMGRTREMSLRLAIGASRARLVQQVVTESTLLWLVGGLVGIWLAAAAVQVLLIAAPVDLPRASLVGIDARVVGVSLLLSMVTGIAFGLIPALGSTPRSTPQLVRSGRGNVGLLSGRLRHALVVADLAIALVLLVGAGLTLRSIDRLLAVNTGFRADGVLTAQFSLVGQAYRTDSQVQAFIDRLVERVAGLPSVEAAAVASQVPMGGSRDRFGVHIQGDVRAGSSDALSAERYSVTADYFRVMQIPLRTGRYLTTADTAASEPVVVLAEAAARQFFGTGEPLGRRLKIGTSDGPWRRVVGVVADVRHTDLAEEVWPQMYLPQSQFTDSFLVLAVRAMTAEPSSLAASIQAVLKEQDPTVPLYGVATLEQLVARSSSTRRFVALLLTGFAAVSLLLAGIGLYGVISYTVLLRKREVGVRMALGATGRHILGLMFASGAATVASGLVLGLALSIPLALTLRSQLYEVGALDWPAFISAIALLVGVAVAAYAIPVRRALSVNPTSTLRDE